MAVDRSELLRRRLETILRALLILAGMGMLLAALGYVIAGWQGVFWTLALGAAGVALIRHLPTRLILRRSGAVGLAEWQAPELHWVTEELRRRAGLPRPITLYYVPHGMLNAFAVGGPRDAGIAVTAGLLRTLSLRELAGVLAHEVSHIRNNDVWVMSLATLMTQLTAWLAFAGQILVLALLPLVLTGEADLPWLPLLVLVVAPTVATLLQLALARNREHAADLEAAALTGDPEGLASALRRLERYSGTWLESVFMPRRGWLDVDWLRTHPPTGERIERLLALAERPRRPLVSDPAAVVRLRGDLPPRQRTWILRL